MHIFFSGIGGTGIGPLAMVAKQSGYEVSGSDKQDSLYIENLRKHGIDTIHIGQSYDAIAAVHAERPIDWYVFSSAVAIEQPDAPEFQFCQDNGIRMTKRHELLNKILADNKLDLVAIAGTHGKTTTTAMAIWVFQQLNIPVSYILPAKSGFAEMGAFEADSKFFVYECDEFDRNFLQHQPAHSLISGIDWDHPDIYPTRDDYYQAFRDFIDQSDKTTLWRSDANRLWGEGGEAENRIILDDESPSWTEIDLIGSVNRRDAFLVANALSQPLEQPVEVLIEILNRFPGVSRRFESISDGIFSDYAHTPEKIRGALQLGHEVAGDNLVVVYEGLHNTRQHFIRQELTNLFDSVKQLYIVPSYLAREDQSLTLLSPSDLRDGLSEASKAKTSPAELDDNLASTIANHVQAGDTVLCISAGGGGSLDEWLRQHFN